MSVIIEFYSLIIRRDRLEAALPGGWPQYLAEYDTPYDGWADDELLRDGAMNMMDFEMIVDHWRHRGLRLLGRKAGRQVFLDMCILSAPGGWSGAECDWLEIIDGHKAQFIGQPYRRRRRRIQSNWSDALITLSLGVIRQWLATPAEYRGQLFLKNWNDRFGELASDNQAKASLVVSDRNTGEPSRYRQIEDLLNAGWAVD